MYRALSPIFDVPDLPTLRRVKPLPKRRRTSETSLHGDASNTMPGIPAILSATDELMAHADALTAQMALQSYYMPVLGGVQDLFKGDLHSATSTPIDLGGSLFGLADFRSAHDDDEEQTGDGDYVDHLQQPGNTKKRKVPANMSGSMHGHDAGSGNSGAEDDPADRGIPSGGRLDRDYDTINVRPPSSPLAMLSQQRKGRLPRATRAALQHKEILRSRKRQLASVLGALSHGDTLALDQALSASYPFTRVGWGGDFKDPQPPRVRLSRRREPRLARAFRAFRAALPPAPDDPKAVISSDTKFSFICHSATSDRLIATKEEVAELHARFEAELAQQAAKAAEAAKQAAAALGGPLVKRADRSKQGRAFGPRSSDPKAGTLEQSLLGSKDRGGKKKKRSALANASNPHHLRNYVPSRLPHSGQANTTQAVQNAQNLLSPIPLRFLSADIPPRRRKKSDHPAVPVSILANPADEWICPFCEYSLFYGDDAGLERAVRNRKKILRRRRRARERAAAAASGSATLKTSEKDVPAEDGHPGFEAPAAESGVTAAGKQTKWKEERGRGGHGIAQGALG
ncbi:uncharacterized protein FIBRA_04685 [Fibroporia radiculosa]|uniref:Uncharacterized protein n=1 Tax=Fibroporia radiculosa TaxID=599839 RepID=J4HWN7_9APHY|nr:uncharacterized protein FIBRA_04685 [Fibroporia radiculosa]CCM02582.1 predicted protein [Fibroporia radiculosa]